MAELLGINIPLAVCGTQAVMIPRFLGRLIGDKSWVRNAERSMFETYDNNFFASDFPINMFVDTFKEFGNYVGLTTDKTKVRRVGWPMEYLEGFGRIQRHGQKRYHFIPQNCPEKQPRYFL